MTQVSPAAGRVADPSQLVDVDRLLAAYYELQPDPRVESQRVAFGTSGHRGSAFHTSFNEAHILAVCEATCRYRQQKGIEQRYKTEQPAPSTKESVVQSARRRAVGTGSKPWCARTKA